MDHKVVGTYASNYASLNHPTHYSDNSISSLSRKISSCYIVDFTTKASTVTCIDSFDPWEYTKKNMWLPHLHPFILPFYDNIFCTQPINKSRNSKATTLPWYESKCAPEWFYGRITGIKPVVVYLRVCVQNKGGTTGPHTEEHKKGKKGNRESTQDDQQDRYQQLIRGNNEFTIGSVGAELRA